MVTVSALSSTASLFKPECHIACLGVSGTVVILVRCGAITSSPIVSLTVHGRSAGDGGMTSTGGVGDGGGGGGSSPVSSSGPGGRDNGRVYNGGRGDGVRGDGFSAKHLFFIIS